MSTTDQPTRRRGGRPKPIPFLHLGPDDQKEYAEVTFNGAPTEAEAQLGALAGYDDTGGYVWSRYPSRLACENWRGFRDPDKYWFRSYNRYLSELSKGITSGTQTLLANGFCESADPAWQEALRHFAVLRFHEAGSCKLWQMNQHMAGSESICYCSIEECGSRLLGIHAVNRYALQLAAALPGWNDDDAMARWVGDPVWRGVREYVEGELAVRDWAEAILVDAVIAPSLYYDPLLRFFGMNAAAHGDPATPVLVSALSALSERRLRWGKAWAAFALGTDASNRAILTGWLDAWTPRAEAALAALAPLYERLPRAVLRHGPETERARAAHQQVLAELTLAPGSSPGGSSSGREA